MTGLLLFCLIVFVFVVSLYIGVVIGFLSGTNKALQKQNEEKTETLKGFFSVMEECDFDEDYDPSSNSYGWGRN